MSAVVSGLLGGVIAAALTAYIAKRVGRSGPPGELRFGASLWILAAACLAFAILPIVMTLFLGHDKEFWAKVGLFVGFFLGAVYCFGEAAFVRGRYDNDGIEFYSPWTGHKSAKWDDLESVRLNDWCGWYTLTFRSGKKVRLSRFLIGHRSALDAANKQEAL